VLSFFLSFGHIPCPKNLLSPPSFKVWRQKEPQRSFLPKCTLQECLSCVYWIICLHVSFSVLSATGVPGLMKH
jgi:hypothetical protein